AGAEVREDHVGAREQALDDVLNTPVAQIQRERALAAVARQEMARLARDERRELPHRITLERLDLDHARAALRQQLRAERNGDELAELDDLDAGERSRRRLGARRGAHRGARVARGSFCYSLGPGALDPNTASRRSTTPP